MRLVDSFDPKFSGPLDVRFSVKTSKELEDLRKSVVSYPFMRVVNEEDGLTYELSKDKSKWELFTAKGPKGDDGKSAYQSALDTGFVGTEEEWIESLKGENGDSAYAVAVEEGFKGTKEEWLESIKGPKGDSLEVGTVSLEEGDLNLTISINEETGKLDFTLTLPGYLTSGEIEELQTTDKTIVGAINELYNIISGNDGKEV